ADRSHRDEHRADPVEGAGEVAGVVEARGTDVQARGCTQELAGLLWVANERSDLIAAREQAADDLAADAAGGADHRSRHRVSIARGLLPSEARRGRLSSRAGTADPAPRFGTRKASGSSSR